jgi:hypothetical protein
MRAISRLKRNSVVFMECDIQEPMRKLAPGFQEVIKNAVHIANIAA